MSRINGGYRQWSIEAELRANVDRLRAEKAGLLLLVDELKSDNVELQAYCTHAEWERDQALLRVEELER